MNMYCISDHSFKNLNKDITNVYGTCATDSMKRAAKNFHDDKENITPVKKCVKVDGAWQKRGHASLNGFVTAIVGDKCVDIEAFSKFCRGCKMWEKQQGTSKYDAWKAQHQCSINHTNSSGAMEAAGAVKMFQWSVDKNNLIYNFFLGDGDTSSFKQVFDSDPYKDYGDPYKDYGVRPEKLECVGHTQKRMGTRLRNLVKSYKGTKTPLHGRNKLTDSVINSMQIF